MYFVVNCTDRKDGLETRMANREAHLAFAAASTDTIKVGGPLLDEDGKMIGSCLICEVEDSAALEEFLAKDPYAIAGLFEKVEYKAWKWVIGAPA